MRRIKLFSLVLIAIILAAAQLGCPQKKGNRIIVFVQGTKVSEINDLIMKRYVVRILQRALQSTHSLDISMYAISSDTSMESPFFEATIRPGLEGENDSKNAVEKFVSLDSPLDRIYTNEQDELVDILGSLFTLDRLFTHNLQKNTVAVYISDLNQQSGRNGWDFGPYAPASRNLEACRKALPKRYGARLRNLEEFKRLRVMLVSLDLSGLFQETKQGSLVPQTNSDEIRQFWTESVFKGLLNVSPKHIVESSSPDPRTALSDLLDS